jgi:hypothetical protein
MSEVRNTAGDSEGILGADIQLDVPPAGVLDLRCKLAAGGNYGGSVTALNQHPAEFNRTAFDTPLV